MDYEIRAVSWQLGVNLGGQKMKRQINRRKYTTTIQGIGIDNNQPRGGSSYYNIQYTEKSGVRSRDCFAMSISKSLSFIVISAPV
jgi:hypothetical protein